MKSLQKLGGSILVCALFGMGAGNASATTHVAPPVSHTQASPHHGQAQGWHGYHHYYGYGFYGAWPWYFPWGYGYATTYYGTSFYADAPLTYVEMAPPGSASVTVQPASSWYYCKNPDGYFPYVKECPGGWQEVPAQPQAPAAAPAPAQ